MVSIVPDIFSSSDFRLFIVVSVPSPRAFNAEAFIVSPLALPFISTPFALAVCVASSLLLITSCLAFISVALSVARGSGFPDSAILRLAETLFTSSLAAVESDVIVFAAFACPIRVL